MVSNPGFDPNPFVEGISAKEYAALREDIDRLENRLLLVNLLATPLLVGAFGFWFFRSRQC